VLIQAAVYGVSVAGATMYCNTKPCSICTKMLINADIHKIVYMEDYPDPLADELLKFTNIRSVHYQKGE
jgi:dCMP deaminase